MDLKSLMNDGAAPEKTPAPTPAGRSSGPQTAPPSGPNGAPRSAGAYTPAPSVSQQSTPLYPPASGSVGPPGNPQSRGLTPLQTPGNGPSSNQYPFPQQTAQSPATAANHQPYRPYEAYSASTPSARPPSYGYPLTNPSPSQYNQGPHQHTTSQSPTPSSHHSQTPHSMRQSPLSHMTQPPLQQPHPHSYHQHSQPSTPLGPPPHIPRHGTNQFDANSPFHQRTFSSTSNGAMASPAQHQASIGSLVQSPSAHHRPSPQRRSGSDYHSQTERERSLSVSPKTMIPPRPPSLGSRHSSQNDVYSARSSMQPSANVAPHPETPGHVQPATPSYAQPQNSYMGGHVAQAHSQASGYTPGHPVVDSLSAPHNQIPLQHSPQKMGMNHLLAPTQHAAPVQNGANGAPTYHSMHPQMPSERSQQGLAVPPQVTPSHELQFKSERSFKSEHATPAAAPQLTEAQYSSVAPRTSNGTSPMEQKTPLKRSAESELSNEPPKKKERRSRYTERPVWANLDSRNPRASQPGAIPNGTATRPRPVKAYVQNATNGGPPPPPQQPPAQSQVNQTNGARVGAEVPAWQQNPPLDNHLINCRNMLGPWERSMIWKTNMPSIVKAVTDWLVGNLNDCREVGYDPRESAIEIEGKIGTLLTQNNTRCDLPVRSMTVLDPNAAYTKSLRFESQMVDAEHKNMNQFLNEAVKDAHFHDGREKIVYKHLHETDSFRSLSEIGVRALPEAIHRHNQRGRDLKLRTTVDSKSGQLKARIVKVKVADLHIFSPQDPYDLRISMNIECNLARPDLDFHALTREPTNQDPVQPDRKKDRLSYKQLKYSIDLTRVDQAGMAPKYELEIEVDANSLRNEMGKMMNGQDSGFTDIVDGFLENAQWLMKQSRS